MTPNKSEHLVPESGETPDNFTITKPSFNDRSGKYHCSVNAFPGVHVATFYGWDRNECHKRAQDFVNAEAYRVEIERLRLLLRECIEVMVNAGTHLRLKNVDREANRMQSVVNKIDSALSQNA